uniref:ADF-H domain-containing protein n=1 Tax=Chrysotila carterae TaxID=13221 RepID=A0A6S9RKX6_CHRCT
MWCCLFSQSSGVVAEQQCIDEFDTMKIRKSYSYIIYKISDDKKYIQIECKGEPGASFAEFCSKLPDGDCRYGILDVPISTKSGAEANKLIFVCWCACSAISAA